MEVFCSYCCSKLIQSIVIIHIDKGYEMANREKVKLAIEKKLQKIVEAESNINNVYLLVHSKKLNIHWNMAFGKTDNFPTVKEQPYHTASIGKVFTAVIIAKMVEEGKINYHDRLNKFLSEDLIKNLHIYNGKDYSNEIEIQHLISHTSGLADFYEDKPFHGKTFVDIVLDEPLREWTPEETIQWTKQNMRPKFPPGKKCHYTDTGFNLLGLIIESVMMKSYHEVLHEYIFQPLNMNATYLSHYSEPAIKNTFPIASINYGSRIIHVEQHKSFSSFYAGGQTISTSEDLLKFITALVEHRCVAKESLVQMQNWRKMRLGIDYGYGLMYVQMLPLIQKYNMWGHLGSIGSFMLYNPVLDAYIIGNFNKIGYLSKSMQFVLYVLRQLAKIK